MENDSPESGRASGFGFFSSWLAVGGIWALVVARPMYVSIAAGPEAITSIGARRFDLLVLVILVSLLVPTLVALAGLGLRKLASEKVRGGFISGVVAILLGLFCWQQVDTLAPLIRLVLPVAAAVAFYLLLQRSAFVKNFAVILGIAVPVVIVGFFSSYPIWSEVGPHERSVDVAIIDSDTPVVMVVFDELPLATLENDAGKIDRKLFPNLALLETQANWYPQMLAAGSSTVQAVPAIMTGTRPTSGITKEPSPPGLAEYPNNVCSILEKGGYEVHSYEPITDLCEQSNNLGSRVTEMIRRGTGAVDGFQETKLAPWDLGIRIADKIASPFEQRYAELDLTRAQAVDDFIEELPAGGRSMSLLHIALPHIFWEFMPDGSHYTSNRFAGVESLTSPPSKAQINSDMQQYLLQMQFTDSEVGRIVQKLKDEGTWDEALFIVTADHGAGFIPGGSRRILEGANSGWVLPVPLFIKFPGQERGAAVKGDVSSVDIAPTILEQLGVDAPSGTDGKSLQGKTALPFGKEITAHGGFGTVQMNRHMVFRLFREARAQKNRVFPGGQLFGLAGHRQLIGSRAGKIKRLKPVTATIDQSPELADVDPASGAIPSYVKAATPNLNSGTKLAVALNGRIEATTATWFESTTGRTVTAVNLPSGDFVDGANSVTFYRIPD